MIAALPQLTFAAALHTIQTGGLLVFPTETFYGIGGDAFIPQAVAALVRAKGRPAGKPVPLLLGAVEQLALVVANPIVVASLAASFWPGPLMVCVPAVCGLPSEVVSAAGLVGVRVSGHPLARRLCLEAGTALMASSANVSGYPPSALAATLDPNLLASTAGLLDGPPAPAGGLPSTIVALEDSHTLRLLREGAVSRQAMTAAGFLVLA